MSWADIPGLPLTMWMCARLVIGATLSSRPDRMHAVTAAGRRRMLSGTNSVSAI